jgi:hypothetical protein
MIYSKNLARYIYSSRKKYDRELEHYRDDALQEIAYAIPVSENETEALRTATGLCKRMLMDFGWRPEKVRERYEEHVRTITPLPFYSIEFEVIN